MRFIYVFSLILAIITNFILTGVLTRRTNRSFIVVTFIVFLILLNTWGIAELLATWVGINTIYFELFNKIAAFGYIFLPIALLFFSIYFTNRSSVLEIPLF